MDLPFLRDFYTQNSSGRLMFQSLFLWIFRSYTVEEIEDLKIGYEFQSLFLWIFRSYKFKNGKIVLYPNKFQSLFLWIFRSYTLLSESIYGIWLLVSLLVLMDLSFLQKEFIEDGGYIFKFQSLFLWIFRSYASGRLINRSMLNQFQSLFLWIFRSYRTYKLDY